MAKSKLKIKARRMRSEGLGIKTIGHALRVSSSTVSLWCRDIVLTDAQVKELERRSRDPLYGKRLSYVRKQQMDRNNRIEAIKKLAYKQTKTMSSQSLFFFGIALYWAEGFKKDKLVGFSNSDPLMIKLFLIWLERYCEITQDRIKLRLGLNEQFKDRTKQIEEYWSQYLKVPIDQFQKPFYQKVKWQKEYENSDLYKGVMRVRVSKSTDLLHKIKGWIEGVSQHVTLS